MGPTSIALRASTRLCGSYPSIPRAGYSALIDPCQRQHAPQCLDRILFVKYARHHLKVDAELVCYFLASLRITRPAPMRDVVRAIMLSIREAALLSDLMYLGTIVR